MVLLVTSDAWIEQKWQQRQQGMRVLSWNVVSAGLQAEASKLQDNIQGRDTWSIAYQATVGMQNHVKCYILMYSKLLHKQQHCNEVAGRGVM